MLAQYLLIMLDDTDNILLILRAYITLLPITQLNPVEATALSVSETWSRQHPHI